MAEPSGIPNYTGIYRRLKKLTGGEYQKVYVCRDTRDNSLCVLKVFKASQSLEFGIDTDIEVQQYAQFRNQQHLIQALDILVDFPAEGDRTVVLELCNGGTVGGLREPIQKNAQWVPEALVWHILSQVIDGLVELRRGDAAHGDCHDDNAFLQFPAESHSNPRALVKPSLDFPNVKLADYMVEQYRGVGAAERLALDLIRFCSRFLDTLTTDAAVRGPSPYSGSLVYWLNRFTTGDNKSASLADLEDMLRQFYDALPSYVEAAGEKILPMWLANYFDEASQQLVDVDDDDASEWGGDSDAGENMGSSDESDLDTAMVDDFPEPTAQMPDLNAPANDLIMACEDFYSLGQDDDYQFVFSTAQASQTWLVARKLAWIGGIAARHARAKCDEFLSTGNSKEDFDAIVAHLDIANQCHTRANTFSVQGIQEAMSQAKDEGERQPWQEVWSVMQGERAPKKRKK